MEQITTSTPSVAMATAQEMAAHAARLTTLTVAPAERAGMLNLLRSACETFAAVATNIANDVVEETPFGEQLGNPVDGLPPTAMLVNAVSDAATHLVDAGDCFDGDDVADAAAYLADAGAALKTARVLAAGQGGSTPERVATVTAGPGLSPDSVIYLITYTVGGQLTNRSYARIEDLDSWRTDLAAAGWTVVGADQAEPPELATLRSTLRARHGVTR